MKEIRVRVRVRCLLWVLLWVLWATAWPLLPRSDISGLDDGGGGVRQAEWRVRGGYVGEYVGEYVGGYVGGHPLV